MRQILNLGSGADSTIVSAVSVDKNPAFRPDIVHDLNVFPWPLETGTFDEVYCQNILESLSDIVRVMEEIHRVSKRGALIHIDTPHFSWAESFTDPTRIHHFGFFSFDGFMDEKKGGVHTSLRFRKQSALLFFHRAVISQLVWHLASRWPDIYEKHWAWIFPARCMSFELEVLK